MTAKKRFVQILVETFQTNKSAAEALGLHPANITHALRSDYEGSQNGILAKAFAKGIIEERLAKDVIRTFQDYEAQIDLLKKERANLRVEVANMAAGVLHYFTEKEKTYRT